MLRVRSSLDRTLICKLRFPVQIDVDWNSHFSLQMKRMDAESKKLKAEVRQLSAQVDSRHSAIYYFSSQVLQLEARITGAKDILSGEVPPPLKRARRGVDGEKS
jgi:hypothetical protein